ncbi:putative tape measure protein [Skermania phage SPI1]|nr:putative tape measure protein [Skermania phage SPI1]
MAGTSVGSINLDVTVDASRVRERLITAIAPAVAAAQAKLDASPLHARVDVEIDPTAAIAEARARLAAADLRVPVRVDVDSSPAALAALRASLGDLRDQRIRVVVDIEADEARLENLARLLESLRDRRIRVDADVDGVRNAESETSKLGSTLGGIGKYAGIGSLVAGGLAAIGGAAGAATALVGGLVAGLAAVGPAAAAIGATAVLGVQGIGDAFTAMTDAAANAASESSAQADKIASAQDRVASAQEAVVSATENADDAQRSLADAQKVSADAAQAVADAYQTAQERLDDYQLSLRKSSLSEREAQLSLAEAQKALADTATSKEKDPAKRALDYQRALLRVERAQVNLTEAQDANHDLQIQAQEDLKKGVEGSTEVVAAKERQAQADRGVEDAARGVERANRQVAKANADVAKAQAELAKAQSEGTASADKFAEAMAKLSPNAQSFLYAVRDLRPAFDDLKNSVQDGIFTGLGDQLRETADVTMPALKEGMGGVAAELNGMATQALVFLRSEEGMRGLNAAFASGSELLAGLRSGTGEFTQGMVDLAATAQPRMREIGGSFAYIGEQIGAAFSQAADSGVLDGVLSGFSQLLMGLGDTLGGLFSGLMQAADIALPSIAGMFSVLGDVLDQLGPSLGELGKIFAESLTPVLPVLGQLIAAIADGLGPVLPVISTLLTTLGQALIPLMGPIGEIASLVGNVLVDTIKALEPALGPLVSAFGSLLQAVAPIIPLIADLVAKVVEALAPALQVIFDALTPVIQILVDSLAPVFEQLAPIIAEVAMTLGQALADALTELAPMLPTMIQMWGDLILAIAPVLPQLADLAVQFLPPVVQIIKDLQPLMVQLVEIFVKFVNDVLIPVVIPAIQLLADKFLDGFNKIADIIHFTAATIFPGIKSGLDTMVGWFDSAVAGIQTAWDKLADVAVVPVNFVIETVWNNGLLKAWQSIDNLLGGVLPDGATLQPIRRATGGSVMYTHGPGNGTKDDILAWLSSNEHVVTSQEVNAAGGQGALYKIREAILQGKPFTWEPGGKVFPAVGGFAIGGAVPSKSVIPAGTPLFASGGEGGLQPIAQLARRLIMLIWPGVADIGGYRQDPYPEHPSGRALDIMTGSAMAMGDEINAWLLTNSGILPLIHNIWKQTLWYSDGGTEAMADRGSPTQNHMDHVHAWFQPVAANPDVVPAGLTGLEGLTTRSQTGGGRYAGPSQQEQSSLVTGLIKKMIDAVVTPVRDAMKSVIGDPPPAVRAIPGAALDAITKGTTDAAGKAVSAAGGALLGAYQKAKEVGSAAVDLGSKLFDKLNPFDSGGVAVGKGFMPKDVIAPERVLSPTETQLFEAMVQALTQIAGAGVGAAGQAIAGMTVDISDASISALRSSSGIDGQLKAIEEARKPEVIAMTDAVNQAFTDTGELISSSFATLQRTASSTEMEAAARDAAQKDQLFQIAGKLSSDVLGPIMSSAVNAGTGFITDLIDGLGADVVKAVNGTTRAVQNIDSRAGAAPVPADLGGAAATPAFGMPGSAFDLAGGISDAVVSVANTARQAFEKVAQDIATAALAQTKSKAGQSRGTLGEDGISGGFFADFIVKLTGVEIEVLDLLENTFDEIQAFRKDSFSGTNANGELISDTAALVQRNQTSFETAAAEQERIQKALIKAVIKYLILNVLLPIITAILGAMITLATTAIGAAIGSAIPIIGTAIGAAVGAAVGAALAGLATVFVGFLAVGAGAALDSFDEGGRASGIGFMPKQTLLPERVLSPRQTVAFETLVDTLTGPGGMAGGGDRTVSVGNVNVYGREPAQRTADQLLSLLP